MANGKNAPKSRPSAQKKGSAKKATKGGNSRAHSAGREAAKSDDGGLLGIALIAIGVLLILGVWFSLAGPAGDGAGTFLGWFLGIGRHVLPIVLIGSGVAVLRDHEPQEPIRLGVGWVLAVLSSLGFIHVIRTPTSLTDLDALGSAGGLLGVAGGEPLQRLVAPAGAVVVLVAAFIGSIALITGASLRKAWGDMMGDESRLLRSKGCIWLAGAHSHAFRIIWGQTGPYLHFEVDDLWDVRLPLLCTSIARLQLHATAYLTLCFFCCICALCCDPLSASGCGPNPAIRACSYRPRFG